MSEASYLDLYLAPLARYLSRDDVTDIYINQPGEVWIETLGGAIERESVPELGSAELWRLARQVAGDTSQAISPQHPLLSATLPGGARAQFVAPPAAQRGIAVAIRRHKAMSLDLAAHWSAPDRPLADVAGAPRPHDPVKLLSWAVRTRKNILIAGGTSSGKTTLLNSLLTEIPASERLIFIEDTPELRATHANWVGLVAVRGGQGEALVTSDDLLQAALRMRPDRIILGELRGPEAFTFLRAINTGHPGSISTIHADSTDRAFVQLAMMAIQAGVGLSYDDAHTLVSEMVDVVVKLGRVDGRRCIEDVVVKP